MTDDLFTPTTPPNPAAPKPRVCKRHVWIQGYHDDVPQCERCHRFRDAAASKRAARNGKRGRSDELTVARILGGRKVGPMGWPWDVEIAGYLRAQCKQLDKWPSLNEVIAMLDAIPPGLDLRAVTLADTPGPGHRTRRLIILDLDEYARWHGHREEDPA